MTRGHGWSLPFTVWRTFTSYSLPAFTGAFYEYFGSKENLLFSIPEAHMQKLHQDLNFHLKLIRGAVNRLHATLYMQLLYYSNHPEFTAVLMLILKHDRKFIDTEAHKKIRDYLKIVDSCIKEGMESGEIHADIDPYYLRASLIGALEHIVINWLLRRKPENLMDAFEPLFEVCLKLIQKKPEASSYPLFSQADRRKDQKGGVKRMARRPRL